MRPFDLLCKLFEADPITVVTWTLIVIAFTFLAAFIGYGLFSIFL
jgi:hypothetical protein